MFVGHAERDPEQLEILERSQTQKRLSELGRRQIINDRVRYTMQEIDKRGDVRHGVDQKERVTCHLFVGLGDQLERGVVFIIRPE
jgi:hypothetical protein